MERKKFQIVFLGRGFIIFSVFFFFLSSPSFSSQEVDEKEPQYAGEFFGMPVSKENYYFAMRIVLTFNTPWGGIPNTPEELEKRVWDELLLSYEAFRRGIEPTDKEVEEEISNTIRAGKGPSNWKEDRKAYAKWVRRNIGGSRTLFENQMRHLVQLKRLRQDVFDSINPSVTEEEAYQEYLNEYNTLSVELVRFDSLEEAKMFFEKVKNDPTLWEKEKQLDENREKKEKMFKRPGFVSLEFLMDLWKFPKEDVYKMLEMDIGSFYPPTPIYKGYAVFKILEIRKADEAEFPKHRDYYYEQIRMKKKYEGFYKWLEDLKGQANIKIFIKPPTGLFKKKEESQK